MGPILEVRFYKSAAGNEPVRNFIKDFDTADMKIIGEDIKTVQFGWPIGMPLVRNIRGGVWEVRIKLENTIVRIIFSLESQMMVLLHGFVKKTQSTPKSDIDLALARLKEINNQQKRGRKIEFSKKRKRA